MQLVPMLHWGVKGTDDDDAFMMRRLWSLNKQNKQLRSSKKVWCLRQTSEGADNRKNIQECQLYMKIV
jgi:hypothetical protein